MKDPYKSLCMILLISLIGGAVLWQTRTAWAGGVVGDGTPESCTSNAVEAALAGGGAITFNCGPDSITIAANTMVIANGIDVTLEGADLITLDGESARQLFVVNAGASLTLNHITLARGNWFGNGGAIANA